MTRPGLGTLWFGLLAGPLAWFAFLQGGYALVPWACEQGHEGVLHALAAAAFLVAVAGAVVAGRAAHGATVDAPPPPGRRRFMALTGAALSGMFGVVIVASVLAMGVMTCG